MEQLDVARTFAASGDESKFDAVAWRTGGGAPLLEGTCGYFEAETQQRAQAMTHTIFIGHVVAAEQFDRLPLLYMGGRFYDSCGLEEMREPSPAT
jgi:flavin reductase (DIM6/NTAB) family NADH-FMN oxidoreductase RutF